MNQIECLTQLLDLSKDINRLQGIIDDCQLSNNTREYAKDTLKTNYQKKYDIIYKECKEKIQNKKSKLYFEFWL